MRALGLALLLTLLAAVPAAAAPRLEALGTFAAPVAVAGPPGDGSRLMVVEQGGTIRLIKNGVKATQPFLDVTGVTLVGEERGLLSVAFPPDYQQSGLFYVFLTARDTASSSGPGELQIREYRRADADHADPASGRVVLAIPHSANANHNGGQLQFTPDGLLWIGTGDGGGSNDSGNNAQNLDSRLGKLLRINPRATATAPYTVPADNPYLARRAPETWAYGLRNPWRFSFDRATGDLVIGDVGQNAHEEIDWAPNSGANPRGRGANYGWPCNEGAFDNPAVSCSAPGATGPTIDQPQDPDGWCAIIGGPVVRDPGLPTLAGRYLFGDYCQRNIHRVTLSAPATTNAESGLAVDQMSAFGEDTCGRVYTASLAGTVSRVVDGTPSACAGPPATGGAPGGGTPPPAADTTPCTVSLKATGTRRVTVRRYLRLRVRTNEACRLTVSGRVPGRLRFRTLHRSVKAATPTTLRLRLTKAANRKLRRATRGKRSVRVRVRVRAVDAAGNARVLTRRVRVRH